MFRQLSIAAVALSLGTLSTDTTPMQERSFLTSIQHPLKYQPSPYSAEQLAIHPSTTLLLDQDLVVSQSPTSFPKVVHQYSWSSVVRQPLANGVATTSLNGWTTPE